MFASLKKSSQNGVPLVRLLQADPLQVLMEDVVREGPLALAGMRRLIVDTLLQHVRSLR